MAKAGGKSKRKHPEKYKKQYHRTAKNKDRAWARHLEANPKDEQNKVAIPKAKDTLKRSK
jgi:lipase chaperone LimK